MFEGPFSKIKAWFLAELRPLPWRYSPTPYAVWISEVMLQQTQAAVVIPYFERWMARFPTIFHLAKASLEEVIKQWEGLGYYSRARYLHEGARYVVDQFDGIIPDSRSELEKIKGLGPYTIGAILSFAFHQRAAAVDGNVLRVLCRYFKIEEDIASSKTRSKVQRMAEAWLPDEEPWIINEALIELGATVCTKSPKCTACPLQESCSGYRAGIASKLPVKTKGRPVEILSRTVAIIQFQEEFLVRRCFPGEVMAHLHEFPYFAGEMDFSGIEQKIFQNLGLFVEAYRLLQQSKHSFTRYRATLHPILCHSKGMRPVEGYQWVRKEELSKLPFSSGHRRLLASLGPVRK